MSDRLSLAVVCYPSLGGSGVVASDLAVGLAERGHRVHVLATAPPSRSLPPSERLSFHRVEVPDYPLFDHAPYEMAMAAAIVALADDTRLDLVHSHYGVPHASSAFVARSALGRLAPRFVTTLHGTDVTGIGADERYRPIARFTVAASDGITVPSLFLRDRAQRMLGPVEHPPIEVIANFVDTDRYAPPAERDRTRLAALFADGGESAAAMPILFHVSNFRALKRVGDLIDVVARLGAELPVRLVLVGDGPERSRAAERAQELGLTGRVCFLGQRADFADDLKHADGFLLPSESESFGVAALEALSAGVPVFGYRVGGLPEVVSADAGRLVEPFDVAALTHAVREVVGDPPKREAMGRAARDRALALFRRGPAIERYEAYYRRVLERKTET